MSRSSLAAAATERTQREAIEWIEALTGADVSGPGFAAGLRSGEVLCQLVNRISPGTIARVNKPGKPFKERENISSFLMACRTLGVQEHALFSTDDLYEASNLPLVANCLHALGGAVQRTVPKFRGPHLGIADTSNARRHIRRSPSMPTQMDGLRGTMERREIDRSRSVVRLTERQSAERSPPRSSTGSTSTVKRLFNQLPRNWRYVTKQAAAKEVAAKERAAAESSVEEAVAKESTANEAEHNDTATAEAARRHATEEAADKETTIEDAAPKDTEDEAQATAAQEVAFGEAAAAEVSDEAAAAMDAKVCLEQMARCPNRPVMQREEAGAKEAAANKSAATEAAAEEAVVESTLEDQVAIASSHQVRVGPLRLEDEEAAAREAAAKQAAALKEAEKEAAAREATAPEALVQEAAAVQDVAVRETAADEATIEDAAKEAAAKEAAAEEANAKVAAAKEAAAKAKEAAAKAIEAAEAAAKATEVAAKDAAEKETAAREAAAKEAAVREAAAKAELAAAMEAAAREAAAKELQAKEAAATEAAATEADAQEAQGQQSTPKMRRSSCPAKGTPPKANEPLSEIPVYGLDKELKEKSLLKYDHQDEANASQWIEAITGSNVTNQFAEALRSGIVLCELVNKIKPGTVRTVHSAGMPFRERENISQFLKACRTLGVQEYMLFSTDDLYEEKNMVSVVKCIYALGGAVQRTVPDFGGPVLGIADTSKSKRDLKRNTGLATQLGGFSVSMEKVGCLGGR